jgi:hypothetical protein
MAAGDPGPPTYDTHGWNHQDIRLAGVWNVPASMRWDFNKYTDHGSTGRMLTIDNDFLRSFSAPVPGRWRPLPRQEIRFATSLSALPPGQYTLTSKTYRDACNPSYREEKFYFYTRLLCFAILGSVCYLLLPGLGWHERVNEPCSSQSLLPHRP